VEQFRSKGREVGLCGGNNGERALEGQLNLAATTVLRQDELVYLSRLPVACGGRTDYKFSSRSSLLMLVSALIGRQRLLALYQDAIASGYRFYSFGDAMLILPDGR